LPDLAGLLSWEELQAAYAVAGGEEVADAAARLFLSRRTAAFRLSVALAKLGLDSLEKLGAALRARP
jgi:hypothetical protein